MRIALAQLNPTVGDLRGNLRKHLEAIRNAKAQGAQLVVFPELSLLGYPPKDLLLKPAVLSLCSQAVDQIANACRGITAIVGAPEKPHAVSAFPLILGRRSLSGSPIGGIAETQEMLDFCAQHRIVADVEVIPIQQINEAYQRMMRGDVRYRFSIDARSLA